MRAPWIHRESALAAYAFHVVLVENHEGQSESILKLLLPLKKHRWRTRHDDLPDFLSDQQFAGDQTSFNRLPETNIISDKQIHARQSKSFSQWLKLVGVELNAGSEWRLEQARVGRRYAVPAQRVQIRREKL